MKHAHLVLFGEILRKRALLFLALLSLDVVWMC